MGKLGATTKMKLVASELNCSLSDKDFPPIQHSHPPLGRVVLDLALPLSRVFHRLEGHLMIRISAGTGIETEKERGRRETEIVSLSATVNEKYETEIAKKTASVLQTTAMPSASKLIENESATVGIGTVTPE